MDDAPTDMCSYNELPTPEYPESVRRFGPRNVDSALIFITGLVDPVTEFEVNLAMDDEGVYDTLDGAFGATKRAMLESPDWQRRMALAMHKVRYTFKLVVILMPDGDVRILNAHSDVVFEGDDWEFIQWLRDQETTIEAEGDDNG